MRVEDAIEDALHTARRALRLEDASGRREALDRAWTHALELRDDHPLRARVAWRRAKCLADGGRTEDALAAVEPVLDGDAPLSRDPSAVRGAEALARQHQDRVGFGHPVALRLWSAWGEHHRTRGDRLLWASARVQLGWDAACRDRFADADALLDPVHALTPADLDGQVPDPPRALARVQLDASHACLRPAVWAGDRPRSEAVLDGLFAILTDRGTEPHLVVHEGIEEAARLLGTPPLPGYADRLPHATGFRAAYGRLLVHGEASDAVGLAPAEGPEWALAVDLLAGRPLDAGSVLRSGCAVFARPDRGAKARDPA